MTTSLDSTVAPGAEQPVVLVDIDEGVAVIRLNRPERMNAYNRTMASELKTAIIACDQDNNVGAIVITGTGDHFCVGADLAPGAENRFAELRESASASPGDALEFSTGMVTEHPDHWSAERDGTRSQRVLMHAIGSECANHGIIVMMTDVNGNGHQFQKVPWSVSSA